ncbi:MAG TPA: ABC transporter substrate-binding protein [Rhizomicrobium sp.]|jgi:phospholipid transport system substrate-binding protein
MAFQVQTFARRTVLAMTLALMAPALTAEAAVPAEGFISDNIQKSLSILNDPSLSATQKSDQFEHLLLGLTDMKRIAIFTLGQYATSVPPAQQDEFAAAFQNYSISVYRSYLSRYAGQTLKVTGSSQRAPDDFIVNTVMADDNGGQQPLQVNFRVRTDSGKPELTDFSVAGIWIALSERDQFAAFLAHNKGDVKNLIAHLQQVTTAAR